MKNVTTDRLLLAAASISVAALLGFSDAAQAQPIAVPDFSFETPVTGSFQDNSGIVAGTAIPNTGDAWYYLGGFTAGGSPVGVQNNAANGFTAGSNPDGTQVGYVNVGAWMGSGSLATIQPNSIYTLTVAEGNRGGGFAQTAGFTIVLAYGSAPDTSLTDSANWAASTHVDFAGAPAVGTYADYSTGFTTGTSESFIGQSLFVLLGSDVAAGNNPISYDNVRLTLTAVPEPSTLALAMGGLALFAVRRWRRRTN
jgi:hypothetical protein